MMVFLNRRARNTFWVGLALFSAVLMSCCYWLFLTQKQKSENTNLETIGFVLSQLHHKAFGEVLVHKNRVVVHRFPANLKITIANKDLHPPKKGVALTKNKIYQLVFHARYALKLSLPITKDKWLDISLVPLNHRVLRQRFIIFFSVCWLVFVLLLFVVIRLISAPISDFSNAIRQLGIDLNAPSLSEIGDAQMRACIRDFNDMQLRIRGLFRERTQLLAAISHDLKTPITRLKLRAEQFENTSDYAKFVKDLDEMEHMLSSILTYAGQTAREETRQIFDLEALLQTLCDDMQDAGKKVTFEGAEKRLIVKGQMNGIRRSFANLIDNAIKYGNEASVKIIPKADKVTITITDKGAGIPEGNFDLAFKPFERLDHSRSANISGSGLGLAIVKETITAHHGDILLSNVAKGGLRVAVTLPLN